MMRVAKILGMDRNSLIEDGSNTESNGKDTLHRSRRIAHICTLPVAV